LWIRNDVAALHQTHVALQFQCTLVGRVQFEDLFHLTFGAIDVAATQVATGQFEFFIEAAHDVRAASARPVRGGYSARWSTRGM
jgi:hypothetical protein